jgi:hypothetical protein
MLDHLLEKVASPIYTMILVLVYGAYISAALGLWYVYPGAVHFLTNAMQIFIASVLILRFHPFRKTIHIHAFDHRFIFASALMLLLNAGLAGFLTNQAVAFDRVITQTAI